LRCRKIASVDPTVLQDHIPLAKVGHDLEFPIFCHASADNWPRLIDVKGAPTILIVAAGKEPAVALKHAAEPDPVVVIRRLYPEALFVRLDDRRIEGLGPLGIVLNLFGNALRRKFAVDSADASFQAFQAIDPLFELLDLALEQFNFLIFFVGRRRLRKHQLGLKNQCADGSRQQRSRKNRCASSHILESLPVW